MKIFVARQPLFDRLKRVVAYELLFRSGTKNFFSANDGDYASLSVLSSVIHVFGLASLTGGKPAFINFTRELLVGRLAYVLSPKQLVIEILETVEPDEEVIKACQELRQSGYRIALDDFTLRPGYERLLSVADIVKVDFSQTKGDERKQLSQTLARSKILLLAEKVETPEDFEEAVRLGYHYFQGVFFCKPEVIPGNEVPSHKLAYLRLMVELNRPDIDFGYLESVLRSDISLSYKLLRYINSAAIGLRYPVTSLRQAIVLLGEQNLRRWILLVLTTSLLEDKPQELCLLGMIRGRFCELICQKLGWQTLGVDPFLVGFLSILDALLDRPLPELLEELPIAPEIRDALLGKPNLFGSVYKIVTAYERAEWDKVTELVRKVNLPEEELPLLYIESVVWSDNLFHALTSV
ncbi:MAG: EAL and HDOD domain-containing protein [Candidatus Fervidibacter sp.]|uniref:EAL and HDOD domain-containing protein n=1 Tax=Candidatus Fervidibacter sp. TaxID=3100871 RepID=UPI004049F34B